MVVAWCRPGEPIADLVFVFMFGKVLKEARSVVIETEYGWTMVYDENQFVEARARRHTAQETEEAHADDCVCFLRHEDPEKLLAAVRFTTEEFCKAAERHGLSVNFGVPKTEALVILRGTGRNKVKNELKGQNPTIQVAGQEHRIVKQYKHMGSFNVHAKWRNGPEVSWRVGSHAGSVPCGCGALLRRGDFQHEVCGCYALLETRLLHSSETWPPLPVGHAKRLEGVQMSWTRKAVKRHRGEGCRGTDAQNSCRVLGSHSGKQGKARQTEVFVAAAHGLSLASRTAAGSGHATALDQGDCWRPGSAAEGISAMPHP